MEEIIRIRNLSKRFGSTQALDQVSFSVYSGEVVGFIGPNGAGKSTTIRTLLGIINRDEGDVTIFGKDVWADSLDIHARISYLPGDVALWDNLSGGEIIDILMNLHGKGNVQKRDELIKRFDLDPRKKGKTYSKGNRQKVGLIAALSCDSDVYIFDEPTSGLDPLMELIFQEEINKLKTLGKAILLSSHILSEVDRLADRIVIIREGRIVEDGNLVDLKHFTRTHLYVQCIEDMLVIQHLLGVHDFKIDREFASFFVDQDQLNSVMGELVKLGLSSIESVAPSLEELFMSHYEVNNE